MDDKRLISEERGRNVATENGIKFFETSAKDNINIEQAFITVRFIRGCSGRIHKSFFFADLQKNFFVFLTVF